MEPVDLKHVANDPPTQIRTQVTIRASSDRPIDREAPQSSPARSARRLDVDGVLSRSLPKLEAEKVRTSSE